MCSCILLIVPPGGINGPGFPIFPAAPASDERARMVHMKLTKLEHAALILEDDGARLFIDPGSFTTPITEATGTVAVVITHEHADHWTPEQLKRILDQSPDAVILGPQGVADAASDFSVRVV